MSIHSSDDCNIKYVSSCSHIINIKNSFEKHKTCKVFYMLQLSMEYPAATEKQRHLK